MEEVIKLKKQSQTEREAEFDRISELHNFYTVKMKEDKDTGDLKFDKITIKRVAFLEKLKSFGFFIYNIDLKSKKFVKMFENVIEEIDIDYITDYFIRYVKKLPTNQGIEDEYSITGSYLEEKVINMLELLFKPILMKRLIPDKQINIMDDLKFSKYLFYKNGYVEIKSTGFDFSLYENLDRKIWKNQILQRNYLNADDTPSVYQDFIMRVCGKLDDMPDPKNNKPYDKELFQKRYNSLRSIIGYNLHNFTRGKLYLTVFTDSEIGDDGEANGRTGKTLSVMSLGKMLNTDEKSTVYCEIPGIGFDPADKHRYDKCNLDTKLVHLNDLKNYFNINNLFSDITEGISAKKLYEQPFTIHSKIIVTTNKTILIDGESAIDRVTQFEFSDFFNSKRSPLTFYGHWFFDDWDDAEWSRFDKFNIECIQHYLKNGLIEAPVINLEKRSLIDHTDLNFVNWLDYKFKKLDDDGNAIVNRIKINTTTTAEFYRYNKRDLYDDFLEQFPDFVKKKFFDQRRFTKWFKFYIRKNYKNVQITEKQSNSVYYIILTEKAKDE